MKFCKKSHKSEIWNSRSLSSYNSINTLIFPPSIQQLLTHFQNQDLIYIVTFSIRYIVLSRTKTNFFHRNTTWKTEYRGRHYNNVRYPNWRHLCAIFQQMIDIPIGIYCDSLLVDHLSSLYWGRLFSISFHRKRKIVSPNLQFKLP